ncbi:single-stranded DNA-binding protein [Achromobacter mucicolens]|uniref:single-stranded DNA-binding protein n=1 Tax=Achromobacter mucicolens TaxID=1389922 RepID=UPI002FE31BB7
MAQLFGLARIGRDAVVRHTQGGEPVANLALPFAYGKKDADGKRPTQWVDASLWGQRAEALAPYLTVGVKVSVTIDEVHIETYER